MSARLLAILALAAASARADDWPQFRGPGGRGVSSETGLPLEWDATKGLRWKAELPGRGLSSPVVVGGRVYLTASDGPEEERLITLCFDAATGKELWRRELHATGPTQCNRKTCMAAPTPAADEERVVVLFATADLAAFDRDGGLLWYRSLAGDYPTLGNNVGMAASPVLHGGRVFVAMENTGESFAVAIDAKTGRNLWKDARSAKINWTTPFVARRDGKAEILFQSPEEVTAYDPATGARLWTAEGKFATIPSPVAEGGTVIAPGDPTLALGPGGRPAWESKTLQSGTATPTLHRGRLYTVNSAGIVTCGDPSDGRVIWKLRTPGPYSASPVAADDRLYLVNEKGLTTVVRLGDAPEIVASNPLGDTILASPAASSGLLLLRSDRTLYCVGP